MSDHLNGCGEDPRNRNEDMKKARFCGLLSILVRFLMRVLVTLLTGLHMLFMRAAAGTRTGLIVA